MKDLILITADYNTLDKENTLRKLVNQIDPQRFHFDLMVISNTTIPPDIASMCNISIYDNTNKLLTDWGYRTNEWFNPIDGLKIQSIFTNSYNNQLSDWRLNILGNSFAKASGYNKIHRIKYDSSIDAFGQFQENSRWLDTYDSITYDGENPHLGEIKGDINKNSFDNYYAYKLDKLNPELLILDEEKIKNKIKHSDIRSSKKMMHQLLHDGKHGFVKRRTLLQKNTGNFWGIWEKDILHEVRWCLPYFNESNENLSFIMWNCENLDQLNGKIIIDDRIIHFDNIPPGNWCIEDLGHYNDINKLTIIINDKIRGIFNFNKYREEFKKVSFGREEK